VSASRFIYIVPNQCHDQHDKGGCEPKAVALAAGDAFLTEIVPTIVDSPAFTERSVLFIAWDDSRKTAHVVVGRVGGGRIPLLAATKHAMRVRGTTPSNHYSLLATIEDGFGLPRIANARDAATVSDLLPDFLVGERERPPVE
jgi:phosphatidylinositol-3-phosphatase